jgi:hypothetical protein
MRGESMPGVSEHADAAGEEARTAEQRRARPFVIAGAVVLLAGAFFGAAIALGSYSLLCETGCQPPPRHVTAQLVIALLALSATAAMTICVALGSYRIAGAWLVTAMALWAAWGAVLDQATHGNYFWQ